MNCYTITLNPGPTKYELFLIEVGRLVGADLRQGSSLTWELYRQGYDVEYTAKQVRFEEAHYE